MKAIDVIAIVKIIDTDSSSIHFLKDQIKTHDDKTNNFLLIYFLLLPARCAGYPKRRDHSLFRRHRMIEAALYLDHMPTVTIAPTTNVPAAVAVALRRDGGARRGGEKGSARHHERGREGVVGRGQHGRVLGVVRLGGPQRQRQQRVGLLLLGRAALALHLAASNADAGDAGAR
jgi:hypothetical protein